MIMMPAVVDHVGIDEDREEVEDRLVNESPARLCELGIPLGLIDPMMEEAFFGRRPYRIEDFASGIEHDVLFFGTFLELDVVEYAMSVAIDALDALDVIDIVFENDCGADFAGKLFKGGVVLSFDPISFGIEVSAVFDTSCFKASLP